MQSTLPSLSSIGPLDRNDTAAIVSDTPNVAKSLPLGRQDTAAEIEPVAIDSRTLPVAEQAVADFVAPAVALGDSRPVASFQTRQMWEGTVSHVRGSEFIAVMSDRTDPSQADEEMSFDVGEVSPNERRLIAAGAVFYFFIGTKRSPAGQQENVSLIKFRRLPVWTRGALHQVDMRAREIRDLLGV